jgi:tellurite resistance protein
MRGIVAGCFFVASKAICHDSSKRGKLLEFLIASPMLKTFDALDVIRVFDDLLSGNMVDSAENFGRTIFFMTQAADKRYAIKSMLSEIRRICALAGFNGPMEKSAFSLICDLFEMNSEALDQRITAP